MLTRRSPEHGFSLLEALLGVSIIGIVLLYTMSLVAQQPRVEHRLKAHREALYLAETQLEIMRSTLETPEPLEGSDDGEVMIDAKLLGPLEALAPPNAPPRMWVEAESVPGRSLYEVNVKVGYFIAGMPYELELESMIWRLRISRP